MFLFMKIIVFLVFLIEVGDAFLIIVFPLTNRIRQSLKEKHARHIADLRAYYESEINILKQKLEEKEISAVEDWKKTNQIFIDR